MKKLQTKPNTEFRKKKDGAPETRPGSQLSDLVQDSEASPTLHTDPTLPHFQHGKQDADNAWEGCPGRTTSGQFRKAVLLDSIQANENSRTSSPRAKKKTYLTPKLRKILVTKNAEYGA